MSEISTNANNGKDIEKSSSSSENIAKVDNPQYGFELIRLGITSVVALTGTALILGSVVGFREIEPAILALVSSTITGVFGFLAGRKK